MKQLLILLLVLPTLALAQKPVPPDVIIGQVAKDSAQSAGIALRYTKAETDAIKPDLVTVATFTLAKTQVVAGKPKAFIITNDELYGSSLTIWNGTSYTILPLIPRPTN